MSQYRTWILPKYGNDAWQRVGAVQSWGAAAPAAIAATASGRRRNAYCRSVGAGGMTACVLAPSATVPQPGRDSINGDVDSLHELVVRRGRIGWSRPMAP